MAEKDIREFSKSPSFGNLEFEQLAAQVRQHLPSAEVERTSEVIQFTTGDFQDESGLVILISPDAIELRLPVLTWSGPHTPVKTSRLCQRLALEKLKAEQLPKLIAKAQAQQRASFGDCQYCGKHKPEGWMHSPDVCHSCAEGELGIVY